jgi:hypothetical protein
MTIAVPANGFSINPFDPNAALTQVVDAVTNWVTVVQTEQTKRAAITAWETTQLARISAQRELFLDYLDKAFDERAQNFRELFGALDRVLGQDAAQTADILGAITTLASSSPFAELSDVSFTVQQWNDGDHTYNV